MSRRKSIKGPAIQHRIALFEALYEDVKANEPHAQASHQTLTINIGPGFEMKAELPNRQEFHSYLTKFRQFISPDEPTFIGYLFRNLPRHIDNPELRARLRTARKAWVAAEGVGWLPLQLNGLLVTGRGVARLYLNGHVFHSDTELATAWHSMPLQLQQLVQYRFHMYEGEVRDALIELRMVIREAREGGYLRDEPLDLSGGSSRAGFARTGR